MSSSAIRSVGGSSPSTPASSTTPRISPSSQAMLRFSLARMPAAASFGIS